MSIKVVKTANMGKSKSGKTGSVYYTLYNTAGTEAQSRTASGVYEIGSGTGLYGVNLTLSTAFSGSIVWDVDSVYAVDEVLSSPEVTRQLTEGRWKIDSSTNQMIFYGIDNTTTIATFNLRDSSGAGSVSEVFERVKA